MKVVHINTHLSGGAAQAALRLHEGLLRQGMDSGVYVKGPVPNAAEHVTGFRAQRGLLHKAGHFLRSKRIAEDFSAYAATRPAGLEMFSDDRCEYEAEVYQGLPECDIVNFHWVAGFIDYTAFFSRFDKPLVWTLHDMNPFTGGCHYDGSCGHFKTRCGDCPQLGSGRETDLSRQIWERKHDAFDRIVRGRVHIVTPSRWLKDQAAASSLFGRFSISAIPNGLDTEVFRPRGEGLKSVFGIGEEEKVVLFVAESIENHRKGYTMLLDAVKDIPQGENIRFVSVGKGRSGAFERHIHLGSVSGELLMSAIYNMADLFVIPSLEDNLPNTILESLACGTPVLGFDIGGIPDMVRPGATGRLVPAGDVKALRQQILAMLSDTAGLQGMRRQCREVAVSEYDLRVQASRYRSLYCGMCET